MLVAINANDKLNLNMQNNVIPVAMAKNMGIIGMKVFADGAMYTKDATWSNEYKHVVRSVGSEKLPSRPLVEYALSTPGISTQLIGIGQIDDDPNACQMTQNRASAQIAPDGLSATERMEIEEMALTVKGGQTNYFQIHEGGLTSVTNPMISKGDGNTIQLSWDTAYAGNDQIKKYLIVKDGTQVGVVDHAPQTTINPFTFSDLDGGVNKSEYKIITVDAADRQVSSEILVV